MLGDVDQAVRDVETVDVWSLWMVSDAEQAANWSNLAAVELGIRSARASVEWCDWMLTQHLSR
ncbi:hypothetical protein ASG73_07325 [Janibacter sp. Soil728]|uniref:hypothetical protein n=1 Tax=Janibacter sp. Soil728 TaxID=1736393 RepID=UPI0007004DF4|nr:hypothetical protein [Janibacter sp. Soil728]KRE37483.1 hypothetical protein ASG73_07325 [Janibacter sp. Soil728]